MHLEQLCCSEDCVIKGEQLKLQLLRKQLKETTELLREGADKQREEG